MNRLGITDRKEWLFFTEHMHLAIGHLEQYKPLAIYYGPSRYYAQSYQFHTFKAMP